MGSMDEGKGDFADTFLFHLPEIVRRKLSAGHFEYILEFDYAKESKSIEAKKRIVLRGILLMPKFVPAVKNKSPVPSV